MFQKASYPLSLSLQPLTVKQIKKVQSLIEAASEQAKADMKECETERHKHLVMIGNLLHANVPISDDEVGVCVGVCVYIRKHLKHIVSHINCITTII